MTIMNFKTAVLCTFLYSFSLAQTTVSGYVFEDSNRNSVKDRREKGISNVAVSNGTEVTLTDKNGRYSLPLYGDHTIFVIKPAGYRTKTDANNLPQFYYHHKAGRF